MLEEFVARAAPSALPPTVAAVVRRPLGRVAKLSLAAWGVVVTAGMLLAAQHSAAPGPDGEPPGSWPSASRITRANDRATLLVFAHPRCPCSRATVAELARLLARTGDTLDAHLILYHPAKTPADWSSGELWDKAASIPGVRIDADEDGREARRFDAETSGTTLLYDRTGALRFHGGITAARGHEGESAGAESIARWATSGAAAARSPVFGCAIWDDARLDISVWRLPWNR